MDEYRQSLAGRALADVLQELEGSGTIDAQAGDTLFDLFDAAVREEFLQAKQQITVAEGESVNGEEQETPPPALFTHTSLELRAGVESYNRFMDKWSVVSALNNSSGNSALLLDKARVLLPPAASRMLIKLHRPPPATVHERHAPQSASNN